jgi:acyl-CoA synthetase (NDP forming)
LSPRPAEVARAVAAAAERVPAKTVVASFPGLGLPGSLVPVGGRGVPNLAFPDDAARALARVAAHGEWRRRPVGVDVEPAGCDLDVARSVVFGALTDAPSRLLHSDAVALCDAIGLEVAASRVVGDVDDAVAAAAEVGAGGPVALKAVRRLPGAKTEASGVALDVHGPEDVRRTYERMASSLGSLMDEVVVQAMVSPGFDVAVRLSPAPVVGAAVEIGPGGAVAGLVGPTARTVLPATDVAVRDLVERSGLAEALGPEGCDALCDVVARVAHLGEEVPEVVAVELNPVIVGPDGARCTDVSAEVAPWIPGPPESVRRLD